MVRFIRRQGKGRRMIRGRSEAFLKIKNPFKLKKLEIEGLTDLEKARALDVSGSAVKRAKQEMPLLTPEEKKLRKENQAKRRTVQNKIRKLERQGYTDKTIAKKLKLAWRKFLYYRPRPVLTEKERKAIRKK